MTSDVQTSSRPSLPIRPLIWCVVAIVAAYVAMAIVRTQLGNSPEQVFAVDSLWPADQYDDSWGAMNTAFEYVNAPHDMPVYSKVFIGDRVKFQYPLSSLLPMYVVRDRNTLNAISAVTVLITVVFMTLVFNELVSSATGGRSFADAPRMEQMARIVLPCLLVLTFYPLVLSYRLGQIQTWLAMGFVIAVWLWMRGHLRASGVVIGLMTLVKPQFGLLLIWAAMRRRWSFFTTFATTLAAGTAASLALYGLNEHLDYVKVLSLLSRHGESFHMNQSVNGLLNRFLFTGDMSYSTFYLPEYNPIVHVATFTTSILLIAGALFIPRKNRGGLADLLLICFTCTIASPVAWTHHYSVLLPLIAALFVWSSVSKPLGRWTLPAVCFGYLLLGTYLGGFFNFSDSRMNVVQSYPFFGAITTLALLYVWIFRGAPGDAVAIETVTSDDLTLPRQPIVGRVEHREAPSRM